MTIPKENPLQNKTLQSIDSLFGFIFKIGEIIFDYITILFEVIGQIGNFGINSFFKYIIGFFASIFKIFENITVYLFSFLNPFKGLFKWLFDYVNYIYNLCIEVIKPLTTQYDNIDNISQYIIGFFIFLSCSVYYFVYKKNENNKKVDTAATTARKNKEAIIFLEYLQFSRVFGKIFSVIKGVFRFFAIVVYSIFIGFFSICPTLLDYYKKYGETSNFIYFIVKCIIMFFYSIYVFVTSTYEMLYKKLTHFNDPILEEGKDSTDIIFIFFELILLPIIEIIKKYYDQIYSHFNLWDLWDFSQYRFAYVIISSFVYVLFLYKLYFWGSDDLTKIAGNNHLYYYFVMSYLLFIGPIVYILLTLPQQSFTGLIILAFSFISLLLMYVSNYYMNYNKSVGMNETPEQESDRNTYNMLFVMYSAIIVFFVNIKILKPNFDQSTILFYTLLNLFFIAVLIGYSISYKIKLTNRINKKAQQYEPPPPSNAIKAILTPEMTSYN